MEKIGYKEMNKYVAHEPSGLTYNALKLNPENLPHNPLINSGAIMVCSLIG
jgi:glutaminase